jgi:uncharacterized metal-binding protein YceD (DUF177 family)
MTAPPRPEFSRKLALAELRGGRLARRLEANEAERAAVARRLGLPGIDRLVAELEAATRAGGRAVEVEGRFSAELSQTCVVSLEPFAVRVDDAIHTLFTTETATDPAAEVDIDPEAEADLEPLTGNAIDLGELVVQSLALALDPHPRRSDAGFTASWGPAADGADGAAEPPGQLAGPEAEPPAGPFADLARLKSRD